jgi:hypothetical protein
MNIKSTLICYLHVALQKPKPEKTVPLYSVHPSGEAKTTGTLTTKRKDKPINAKRVN